MPMAKLCRPSVVKRYKAIREPRCNGGDGCARCWDKWHMIHDPQLPLEDVPCQE